MDGWMRRANLGGTGRSVRAIKELTNLGAAVQSIQPLSLVYTPSGAVKEVIARVGLGFGRCCP
jgi:hypothetical protein